METALNETLQTLCFPGCFRWMLNVPNMSLLHLRRQFALFGILIRKYHGPTDFCYTFASPTMVSPLVWSLSWLLHNILLSTCDVAFITPVLLAMHWINLLFWNWKHESCSTCLLRGVSYREGRGSGWYKLRQRRFLSQLTLQSPTAGTAVHTPQLAPRIHLLPHCHWSSLQCKYWEVTNLIRDHSWGFMALLSMGRWACLRVLDYLWRSRDEQMGDLFRSASTLGCLAWL